MRAITCNLWQNPGTTTPGALKVVSGQIFELAEITQEVDGEGNLSKVKPGTLTTKVGDPDGSIWTFILNSLASTDVNGKAELLPPWFELYADSTRLFLGTVDPATLKNRQAADDYSIEMKVVDWSMQLANSYLGSPSAPQWEGGTNYPANTLILNGSNLYLSIVGGVSSTTSNGPTGITSGSLWTPSTTYSEGNQVINGAMGYQCVTAGTSMAAGPAGTGSSISDGTVTWEYTGVATTGGVPWSDSTAYIVGNQVINGGSAYQCTVGGISASAGPTGVGSSITDGTAIWEYTGPAAVDGTVTWSYVPPSWQRPVPIQASNGAAVTQKGFSFAYGSSINNFTQLSTPGLSTGLHPNDVYFPDPQGAWATQSQVLTCDYPVFMVDMNIPGEATVQTAHADFFPYGGVQTSTWWEPDGSFGDGYFIFTWTLPTQIPGPTGLFLPSWQFPPGTIAQAALDPLGQQYMVGGGETGFPANTWNLVSQLSGVGGVQVWSALYPSLKPTPGTPGTIADSKDQTVLQYCPANPVYDPTTLPIYSGHYNCATLAPTPWPAVSFIPQYGQLSNLNWAPGNWAANFSLANPSSQDVEFWTVMVGITAAQNYIDLDHVNGIVLGDGLQATGGSSWTVAGVDPILNRITTIESISSLDPGTHIYWTTDSQLEMVMEDPRIVLQKAVAPFTVDLSQFVAPQTQEPMFSFLPSRGLAKSALDSPLYAIGDIEPTLNGIKPSVGAIWINPATGARMPSYSWTGNPDDGWQGPASVPYAPNADWTCQLLTPPASLMPYEVFAFNPWQRLRNRAYADLYRRESNGLMQITTASGLILANADYVSIVSVQQPLTSEITFTYVQNGQTYSGTTTSSASGYVANFAFWTTVGANVAGPLVAYDYVGMQRFVFNATADGSLQVTPWTGSTWGAPVGYSWPGGKTIQSAIAMAGNILAYANTTIYSGTVNGSPWQSASTSADHLELWGLSGGLVASLSLANYPALIGGTLVTTPYGFYLVGSASLAQVSYAQAFSATGSIAAGILDVTASTGVIVAGMPVSGASLSGLTITQQISGVPGGAGLYQLSSTTGTIASEALTIGGLWVSVCYLVDQVSFLFANTLIARTANEIVILGRQDVGTGTSATTSTWLFRIHPPTGNSTLDGSVMLSEQISNGCPSTVGAISDPSKPGRVIGHLGGSLWQLDTVRPFCISRFKPSGMTAMELIEHICQTFNAIATPDANGVLHIVSRIGNPFPTPLTVDMVSMDTTLCWPEFSSIVRITPTGDTSGTIYSDAFGQRGGGLLTVGTHPLCYTLSDCAAMASAWIDWFGIPRQVQEQEWFYTDANSAAPWEGIQLFTSLMVNGGNPGYLMSLSQDIVNGGAKAKLLGLGALGWNIPGTILESNKVYNLKTVVTGNGIATAISHAEIQVRDLTDRTNDTFATYAIVPDSILATIAAPDGSTPVPYSLIGMYRQGGAFFLTVVTSSVGSYLENSRSSPTGITLYKLIAIDSSNNGTFSLESSNILNMGSTESLIGAESGLYNGSSSMSEYSNGIFNGHINDTLTTINGPYTVVENRNITSTMFMSPYGPSGSISPTCSESYNPVIHNGYNNLMQNLSGSYGDSLGNTAGVNPSETGYVNNGVVRSLVSGTLVGLTTVAFFLPYTYNQYGNYGVAFYALETYDGVYQTTLGPGSSSAMAYVDNLGVQRLLAFPLTNGLDTLVGVWGANRAGVYQIAGTTGLTYSDFYIVKAGALSTKYSIFAQVLPNGSVAHIEGVEQPTPVLWIDNAAAMSLN